jgi:glycosyltransferase involved in cell wall biosynthesis
MPIKSNPLISVIIPAYNVEQFIQVAIESVLQQTVQDFEIIVVDDASPDQSVAVVQSILDPRIRVIHQKNKGLPGARNAGIRVAQGEYLAFLDADDAWRPEKLQCHLEHFAAHPEVGLSFTRSEFMGHAGNPLGVYQMAKITDISFLDLICTNPVGNGSSLMVRRALIDDLAFVKYPERSTEFWYFDEDFRHGEDIECWTRVAAFTRWKIEGINKPLTFYRLNSGGLSAGMMNQYQGILEVIDKTLSFTPPPLNAQEIRLAKAFVSKSMARNAIRFKNGEVALHLMIKALSYDSRIFWKSPQSTCFNLGAAVFLNLFPLNLYLRFEQLALKLISLFQKKSLLQTSNGV